MQAAPSTTTSGTSAPAPGPGFPPFKSETFPSQLFWLAISFAVMFVILWRMAAPRIEGAMAARKAQVGDDLGAAEAHRKNAEKASADYEAALAAARAHAQSMAEDNHQRIRAEIDDAKAKAETEAQAAQSEAESRIAALKIEARGHVRTAARDAAVAIVARLTGDSVSGEDAARAVGGA